MADSPLNGNKKELSMEMRLLLALLLTVPVIFLSQYLFPTPAQPPAKKTVATAPSPAAAGAASPDAAKAPAPETVQAVLAPGATPQEQLPNVRIDNGRYQISISNQGATIRSWMMPAFKGNDGKPLQVLNTAAETPPVFSLYFPSMNPVDRDATQKTVNWSFYQPTVDPDGLGVTYTFSNGHLAVRKSLRFEKNSFLSHVSTEVTMDGKPVHHVDSDNQVRAEFAAKCAGGQTNGSEPGDEHGVIAVDADLLQALVDGAEAARHLRAIGVAEFRGQMDQVLLFGQQIVGHAAIALPAVSAAVTFAGAGDHVAAPAIVAHAAAGDVVDNHAIAHLEAAAALAGRDDLPARLVAGNHSLVALGALPQMLVIDAANIRTADCGGLHAQQHLAMPWSGHRHSADVDGRVAGQERCGHRLFHLTLLHEFNLLNGACTSTLRRCNLAFDVPEIFPGLPIFPKEDLPFDQPAVAVDSGDLLHLFIGQRRKRDAREVGAVVVD